MLQELNERLVDIKILNQRLVYFFIVFSFHCYIEIHLRNVP